MDLADSLYGWLPWPINQHGFLSAVIFYCLAVATGWIAAWFLALPVLQQMDDDYYTACEELEQARANVKALLALVESGQGIGQSPEYAVDTKPR